MTTLVDRLRSAILARKALAEQASGPRWSVVEQDVQTPDGGGLMTATLRDVDHDEDLVTVEFGRFGLRDDDLRHIAANDPAQINRDCDKDLALLDTVLPAVTSMEETIYSEWGSSDDAADNLLKLLADAYGIHVCDTPCDPDCDEPCHEVHEVTWKRTHQPPSDVAQHV